MTRRRSAGKDLYRSWQCSEETGGHGACYGARCVAQTAVEVAATHFSLVFSFHPTVEH